MELINETPLPSALVPSGTGSDEVFQLVLTSMTLGVGRDGAQLTDAQLPLKLKEDPAYANDAQHLRDCVSVCVTGFAYPDKSGKRGTASLAIGGARIAIAVFGPRVWESSGFGAVKPSAPLSFERVAMTWRNAYGGSYIEQPRELEHEGEPYIVPEFDRHYGPNPMGVGYAGSAQTAAGKPLPQLEHPDHLLSAWDDQPEPVCFAPYPMFGSLRAQALMTNGAVDLDRMGRLPAVSAPRTTFPKLAAGTRVVVEGMRPGGETLTLHVPEPPVRYAVQVGGTQRSVVPYLDTLEIDAEAKTARLLYRAGFRYPLIQGEARHLQVLAGPAFPDVLHRPAGEA